MSAAIDDTAAMLHRSASPPPDETLRRVASALSRSLAEEGFGDDLYDALEDILSAPSHAARAKRTGSVARVMERFLGRLGAPPRPLRLRPHATPPRMDVDEAARIADRFRRATTQLTQVVPYRVATYPAEELRVLLDLRDERPDPDQTVNYLRRYALAVLALLDLIGDEA